MSEVSSRELRNHGGDVVDRVAKGERLTITRSGTPVAEYSSECTGGIFSCGGGRTDGY